MTTSTNQCDAHEMPATGFRDDPAEANRASGGAAPAVSLRDEVLGQLTPARRALLAEHANRVPADDIVWGIALVLQDLHDDTRSDSRRLRGEMAEVLDCLHRSRLRIERELEAATDEWRQVVDEALREHRRRDRTAMQRAVARLQEESMREIVDTHLSDILRVLSGRVLAIIGLAVLGGMILGVAGLASLRALS